MAEDWFKRFQDFSMAIDFVDDDIFENLKDLLEKSFEETWGICFFRVLLGGHSIQTGSGETPALSTIWSSHKNKMGDVQIDAGEGGVTNQTSYAYRYRKKLWLKANDDGKLAKHTSTAEGLEDQWSGCTDMPAYSDYGGGDTRTSVILPLEYGGRVFGVLNLEFLDAMPISSRARDTTDSFTQALARIIWLHETNLTQLDDTRSALQQLHDGYESAADAFRRRTVFLASSGRADRTVVKTLKSVLENEFSEQFDLEFWAEEATSGGINDQVRSTIASSEFGICYMSEPIDSDSETQRYADNPNVLFEAGMFQMLHQLRDDASDPDAARWIPVRESSDYTTPLPFDFAGDRVLKVPRDPISGEVDEEKLAESLRSAVRVLTVALGID